MILKLKSKSSIKKILLINFLLSLLASLIVYFFNISWNFTDYQIADIFYRKVISSGKGPVLSDKVVYLNITSKSYNYLKSNSLDRKYLAKVNNILAELSPEGVMYDMLFAHPSNVDSDSAFTNSIKNLNNAYFPAGFELSVEKRKFRWESTSFNRMLKNKYLKKIYVCGNGEPYYSVWSLSQYDPFMEAAFGSGHISVKADEDGVFRHIPLVIKVDSAYFPTISLSMFLDYLRIPFEKIKIEWGKSLIIPALSESFLEKEMAIPIDDKGNVFIPFPCTWNKNSHQMEIQNVFKYQQRSDYFDELLEFFEGKFVIIGDVSVGIGDQGKTSLEHNVPLVAIHGAVMNGFLTNSFYSKWDNYKIAVLILFVGFIIGISALPKSNSFIYAIGIIIIIGLIYFTYSEFIHFTLFPVFTVISSVLIVLIGMIISLQVISYKDHAFIKNAFSKYVPGRVVDQLIANPELLALGGEEKIITVLFSDIKGFTTISEKMKPTELVALLNHYLTEMTNIIIEQGGIIDKYIGDAIVAEFGAPLSMENHADAAVEAAIKMQKILNILNDDWRKKGYPEICCRIGINTGSVIIGNMGSNQVFDYTVIGDNVNLAARLESANKKYNTRIMISEFTYDNLEKKGLRIRPLDIVKVKGKSKAVKVFEVIGSTSEFISEQDKLYYEYYTDAFESFLRKDFNCAYDKFQKALELRPEDPASINFIERIKTVRDNNLEDDWDGSVVFIEK